MSEARASSSSAPCLSSDLSLALFLTRQSVAIRGAVAGATIGATCVRSILHGAGRHGFDKGLASFACASRPWSAYGSPHRLFISVTIITGQRNAGLLLCLSGLLRFMRLQRVVHHPAHDPLSSRRCRTLRHNCPGWRAWRRKGLARQEAQARQVRQAAEACDEVLLHRTEQAGESPVDNRACWETR